MVQLVAAIRGAYAHGLSPDDYHLRRIEAALDTDALVSLVHHLRYGKTDPKSHEPSANFRDTVTPTRRFPSPKKPSPPPPST